MGEHPFPEVGFVRLNQIIAPNGPIPVSKSTWLNGIKSGRFPKPVKPVSYTHLTLPTKA